MTQTSQDGAGRSRQTDADAKAKKDGRLRPQKLEGRALQVNENSVEEGEPVRPVEGPATGASGGRSEPVEGKALRVNENSADEDRPFRPSTARR